MEIPLSPQEDELRAITRAVRAHIEGDTDTVLAVLDELNEIEKDDANRKLRDFIVPALPLRECVRLNSADFRTLLDLIYA